jgi:hypothetical protein
MRQYWFPEPDEGTYLPTGYLSFHDTINLLGKAKFPSDWHGVDECRLRNTTQQDDPEPWLKVDRNDFAKEALNEVDPTGQHKLLNDDERLAEVLSQLSENEQQQANAAHQAELTAAKRYEDLVSEIRTALIENQMTSFGIADDGSEEPLLPKYWRSSLAMAVLYKGSCLLTESGFTNDWRSTDSTKRFIMFESKTIKDFIWSRTNSAKARRTIQSQQAIEWLSKQMSASPEEKTITKADAQKEFNKQHSARVSDHDWRFVWSESVTQTGASAWSKTGPIREK